MIVTTNNGECNFYVFLAISSVSGPYSAIDPYVKPFFPPDPPPIRNCEFDSCLIIFRFGAYSYTYHNRRDERDWLSVAQLTYNHGHDDSRKVITISI